MGCSFSASFPRILYAICSCIAPLRPLTKPPTLTIIRTDVLPEHLGYLDAGFPGISPTPSGKDGIVMGKVTIRYEKPKQPKQVELSRSQFKVARVWYQPTAKRLSIFLQGEPAENRDWVVYIGDTVKFLHYLVKVGDMVEVEWYSLVNGELRGIDLVLMGDEVEVMARDRVAWLASESEGVA